MKHSLDKILEFAFPGRPFSTIDNKEIIVHDDGPMPTQAELDTADASLSALDYLIQRKKSYPFPCDDISLIWNDIDQGKLDKTGQFYLNRLAINNKYPEGS